MKYYNAGVYSGVVGIKEENIKHQSSEYTFITGGGKNWIKTIDLKDTREEAENSPVAEFL